VEGGVGGGTGEGEWRGRRWIDGTAQSHGTARGPSCLGLCSIYFTTTGRDYRANFLLFPLVCASTQDGHDVLRDLAAFSSKQSTTSATVAPAAPASGTRKKKSRPGQNPDPIRARPILTTTAFLSAPAAPTASSPSVGIGTVEAAERAIDLPLAERLRLMNEALAVQQRNDVTTTVGIPASGLRATEFSFVPRSAQKVSHPSSSSFSLLASLSPKFTHGSSTHKLL